MAIDKIFDGAAVDGIADNLFNSVSNSVSEIKAMQQRKAAENVQLVIQALKKIDSDIREKYDGVTTVIEKRVATIKDGRDGINGKDGRDGKDGRNGKDGAPGPRGMDGARGMDGRDGTDGVSVTDARIDFDGSLIIGLSTGREINVGEVVAPDLAEKIKVITNGGGTSQQVLDTLTSLQTQINNIYPSQAGNAGKFLTTNGSSVSWAQVAGGLSYQGTWNASTNTPTLASGVGINGYYYITATAGSTNLDGITDWQIGDWLVFNGTAWQKIDQSNLVTSVAGRTGAVVLANTDISGLGTMSTQNANSVAVTGGSVNGTTVGASTASSGAFTTLSASGNVTLAALTATRVPYASTGGLLVDSANLTFNGTTLTSAGFAGPINGTVGATTANSGAFTTLSASGVTTVQAGSAAAPAITTSGDTNTGIFFPAADTIAFAEGGAEVARFDSAGNLGIGTTSPNYVATLYKASLPVLQLANSTSGSTASDGLLMYLNGSNAVISNQETGSLAFETSGLTRATLDSSGNLGLGVTPNGSWEPTAKAIQISNAGQYIASGSTTFSGANQLWLGNNGYLNSSGQWIYLRSVGASQYRQLDNAHAWYTAPSGTAGNAISFTQVLTVAADGKATSTAVGVDNNFTLNSTAGAYSTTLTLAAAGGGGSTINATGASSDYLRFAITGTERARIDSSGNLLVGVSFGSNHIFSKNAGNGAGTTNIFEIQNAGSDVVAIFLSGTSYGTSNSAGTSLRIGRSNTTSRSINAGGTINASGADYAEYMTKASDFTVAKGDVLGINADGKLTNVFADAVSFCVKSTDPSYVGNDKWGCDFSEDPEGLEAARQLVDRIAFAGQVPVNVMGATPGQYIVPVSDNGAIKGIAKNEADMTLAEYMKAVGKVIAIEADGRAKIIVKVA
jgi:hypothetical protein